MVLPIPAQSGLSRAASKTARLASLQARFKRSRSGPSCPSSDRILVNVLTAIELACWPAAWPPIPSQTTSSVSRPPLLRHTTTESSFSSRSRPGSVAHAIRSRISGERTARGGGSLPSQDRGPLGSENRELNRVLPDGHAVAVIQLFLLDRFAVDKRAVGAAQVDDPELVPAAFEAGVVSARGRVSQDDVVVW